MHSSEREKEIMNLLAQNDYATVEYLAEKIHISQSSIRRDLIRLEQKGLITRSYGGAELKNSVNRQIPFFLRSHKNVKEKSLAAKKASALVKPGDVIFLDGSTSTYFMLEYLKNIRDITVVTNCIASMNVCSEYKINSCFAGGQIDSENYACCIGEHAINVINSIHADFFFFSVQSITKDGLLYDCFSNEVLIRKMMMKNSEKSVFLCDGSKINHISAYKMCDVSEIDYVVSDIHIEDYLDGEYKNITFIC